MMILRSSRSSTSFIISENENENENAEDFDAVMLDQEGTTWEDFASNDSDLDAAELLLMQQQEDDDDDLISDSSSSNSIDSTNDDHGL